MKKATCKEMGGKCREHVMQMVQSGDAGHKAALDSMMAQSKEDQENWYNEFRANFASLQDV